MVVGGLASLLPSSARACWWEAIPFGAAHFCPTIFFSGLLGVLRGLFPGTDHGAHLIFPDSGADTQCGSQYLAAFLLIKGRIRIPTQLPRPYMARQGKCYRHRIRRNNSPAFHAGRVLANKEYQP